MAKRRREKTVVNSNAYGVPVPQALHEAIETERDNLSRAQSLLRCLVISLQHESDDAPTPDYADVAEIACELVRGSVGRLDALALEKLLLRNKIREAALSAAYAQAPPQESWMPQQEYAVALDGFNPLLHHREPGSLQ
jgi:hypothetical protein